MLELPQKSMHALPEEAQTFHLADVTFHVVWLLLPLPALSICVCLSLCLSVICQSCQFPCDALELHSLGFLTHTLGHTVFPTLLTWCSSSLVMSTRGFGQNLGRALPPGHILGSDMFRVHPT